MDRVSELERSRIMGLVPGKNSRPELLVRQLLHGLGFRFRLHAKDLPGKPDVVLPKWKTVVFVHGCFWHRHRGCKRATTPAANFDYWQAKFERNKQRDQKNKRDLRKLGWRVLVVWECETKRPERLAARFAKFFGLDQAKRL